MPNVDLTKLDLRRPDPNYKSDPKLRGDVIDAPAEDDKVEAKTEEEDLKPKDPVVEDDTPAPVAEEEEEETPVAEAAEEEEEDEEEDDAPQRQKSQMVPYSKFRKTKTQVKELTKQLAEMQAKLEGVKDTQTAAQNKEFEKRQARIEELYEQVEEQRALGNSKEAGKLQKELDGLRADMSRAESRRMAMETTLRSQQVQVFNTTLTQIEAVYPQLVEDSDDFDEDLVGDLEETIKGYEKLGYSMVDALQKASRRILRYDPLARGKAAYLPGFAGVVPGEKKAEEEAPAKKEPPKAAPKKTDVRKNVEASKKQPADPVDDTNDVESKLDMKKISRDDYMKLPAATRARLRGDTVA